MAEGHYTIPTRVYLSAQQREQLLLLLRQHEIDLPDLLTELLISFLEHLPEETPAPADETEKAEEPDSAEAEKLRERRAEVRRLRARLKMLGNEAPHWLASYVAELEREIARLEQETPDPTC